MAHLSLRRKFEADAKSLKISSSSLKILSPSLKIEIVKMNGKDGKRLKIGPKSTGIPKGQGGKFSWKKGDEQHFIKYQNLNQKVPHFLKVTLQKKSKAAVGHCFKSMAEILAYDGETELHFDMKNKNGNIIATAVVDALWTIDQNETNNEDEDIEKLKSQCKTPRCR